MIDCALFSGTSIDEFFKMEENLGKFFDHLDHEFRFTEKYQEINNEYIEDPLSQDVKVWTFRLQLLLKDLVSKDFYPGIPQETTNQLIFGIMCYTYHNLSNEVKNILNHANIIQSTELFGIPTRFIQHPAANDAIRTKQRVIECALCTDLHEFFHDDRVAPSPSEIELKDIFEEIESDLDLKIKHTNVDVNQFSSNHEILTIAKDQTKERLNKTVQDLKKINLRQNNEKTKQQFIFGVICYVYHQFSQRARSLFVDDSIIIDEEIKTTLPIKYVNEFTGQSNQYAINSEDRVIACAVCNDLDDFFVKRGKYSKIISKLEEEFDDLVIRYRVNDMLRALNSHGNDYNDKFRDDIRIYLNTVNTDLSGCAIIGSLAKNSQKFADQFIVGFLCFVYHQLNYKIRSSFTGRERAIYTESSSNLWNLYHHICNIGPSENAEPWLIKTKNRVIEFTFCDDVDAFFGRRP